MTTRTLRLKERLAPGTQAAIARRIHNLISADTLQLVITFEDAGREGGSADVALSIYRILTTDKELERLKIITYNETWVTSASNLVFLAGEKRLCSPDGRFLFHKVQTTASSPGAGATAISAVNEAVTGQYIDIVAECTGQDRAVVETWFSKETIFTACQARTLGIVHEIKSLPDPAS
jgi:ATP-dependent protease ClpP protease subunit